MATYNSVAEALDAWELQDPAFTNRLGLAALLKPLFADGFQGRKVAFGSTTFAAAGVTKEVPVQNLAGDDITTIEFAVAFPKVQSATTELLFMDGVVDGTPKTTTVTRAAGTTSGLGFWYFIIGT